MPSQFRVYSYDNYTLTPTYQVGANQKFGYYTGNITLTGDTFNQTIQLNAEFIDDTPPVIDSVSVPDVMATQKNTFQVDATDNLNISKVEAEVFRRQSVQRNNQTVYINKSVASFQLPRESTASTSFSSQFSKTSEIGTYWANITVTDTSNNTAKNLQQFKVQGLNTTHVLSENFRLDAVEPGTKAEETFLKIDSPTEVTLQLQNFTHEKSNSSITVGIRKPGDQVDTEFSNLTGTSQITVNQEGVYTLVVETDKNQDDYEGQIKVIPPKQHFNIPTVRFEGSVIDPEYPEPENYSLDDFEGRIYYDSSDDTEKDKVIFHGETSAEVCKGFESFKQCFGQDYSLNSIPEIQSENKKLHNRVSLYMLVAAGSVIVNLLFAAVFIRNQNLGAQVPTVPYTEKK
ncbi:MAG: hypothetical protein ABEJ56_05735 [Candidatus Nanohaloarchaea archaeon]